MIANEKMYIWGHVKLCKHTHHAGSCSVCEGKHRLLVVVIVVSGDSDSGGGGMYQVTDSHHHVLGVVLVMGTYWVTYKHCHGLVVVEVAGDAVVVVVVIHCQSTCENRSQTR